LAQPEADRLWRPRLPGSLGAYGPRV